MDIPFPHSVNSAISPWWQFTVAVSEYESMCSYFSPPPGPSSSQIHKHWYEFLFAKTHCHLQIEEKPFSSRFQSRSLRFGQKYCHEVVIALTSTARIDNFNFILILTWIWTARLWRTEKSLSTRDWIFISKSVFVIPSRRRKQLKKAN